MLNPKWPMVHATLKSVKCPDQWPPLSVPVIWGVWKARLSATFEPQLLRHILRPHFLAEWPRNMFLILSVLNVLTCKSEGRTVRIWQDRGQDSTRQASDMPRTVRSPWLSYHFFPWQPPCSHPTHRSKAPVTLKHGAGHISYRSHAWTMRLRERSQTKARNCIIPLMWHSGKVCEDRKQIWGCWGVGGRFWLWKGTRELVALWKLSIFWFDGVTWLSKLTEQNIEKSEFCCIQIIPR